MTGLAGVSSAALLEAAPDAMVCVAADGRIALVNSQAEKLFGYPRAELADQLADLLVPGMLQAAPATHRAGPAADPQPERPRRPAHHRRRAGRD
jgi:PAS domain S-box-containing protein